VASVLQLIGMFESSFILTGDTHGGPVTLLNDPMRHSQQSHLSLALDEVTITEDEDVDEGRSEDEDESEEGLESVKNPNDRLRLLSSDLLMAMSTRSTHFSNHHSVEADSVTAEELMVLQEDDDVSLSVAEKQVAVIARRYTVLREVRGARTFPLLAIHLLMMRMCSSVMPDE
jgi:hypothetical protein